MTTESEREALIRRAQASAGEEPATVGPRRFGRRRRVVAAPDGGVVEQRRRPPDAGASLGVARLVELVARLVRLVAGALVLVIVAAIALRALDANSANSIVSTIHDWGRSLVGPFNDVFTTNPDPKIVIAENWGLAAAVYLVVGMIIANVIARIGGAGLAVGARRRERP